MYDDNISFYILYVDNVFIADDEYWAVLFFKFCTLQYKTLNAPPPKKEYHVILVFSLSYCIVFF